jgi:hypothetical protein
VKNDSTIDGLPGPQSEYPSRGQPARDAFVLDWLAALRDLENHSNPVAGRSAEHKDIYAFRALQLAGQLVQATAGWAIDHQYGLALGGLMFVPLVQPDVAESPEYLEAKRLVDDHVHENRGLKARRSVIGPDIARRALINVLLPNSGGLSEVVWKMVLEALLSLENGEVLPILAPIRESKKLGYRELRLQLQALGFVAYEKKLGRLKKDAQEFVAGAFGVSPAALRNWEKRLLKQIGKIEVAHAISTAKSAALKIKAGRRAGSSGIPATEIFGMMYNHEAVRRAAATYKQIQRTNKQVKDNK